MSRERLVWVGVVVLLLAGGGWSYVQSRSAVRAQIDAGIHADRIQRELDVTSSQLTATVQTVAVLRRHSDSTDAELAKAHAFSKHTARTLQTFRDSVAVLPVPETSADSIERLQAHLAATEADRQAKIAELAKAEATIEAVKHERAVLLAALASALARVDSIAAEHAKYIAKTKDWGPPPSRVAELRNDSIKLGGAFLLGRLVK